MSRTDGRAAIVTGAASGIGRAIVERLQADGVNTLAVDLNTNELDGEVLEADLTTREGNKAAVDQAAGSRVE
jgi:3-hydroxybutyrate dehydrogenase